MPFVSDLDLFEGFGMCMRWNRQDELQAFVQDVVAHIGGSIYTDRQTGLLNLKLIRDDYDVEDLPIFDYNSGLLSIEPEASSRQNAINEVIVKFTDPLKNESRSVRAQNLASMQSLDSKNSTTKEYAGIPTAELGSRIAQRDLKAVSSGGKRYEIKLDRRAWRMYPGAVFRITAPDKGLTNLVLRAGKVEDGNLTNGEIKVTAVLDVFGLSAVAFTGEEPPGWEPVDPEPKVIENRFVRETTYMELYQNLSASDLSSVDADSGSAATIAARPGSSNLDYNILSRTGSESYVIHGAGDWCAMVVTSVDIGPYTVSLPFVNAIEMGTASVNSLLQLGDEIVFVTAISLSSDGVSGTLTIERGCVDTVPVAHGVGTKGFFIQSTVGFDEREYAAGESVDVKLQSVTTSAVLDLDLASSDTIDIVARQNLPYPPGAFRINGADAHEVETVTGDVTFSWTHRDRLLQKDQIVSHWDTSVGPEAGVTYRLQFYDLADTLLDSVSGITAATYTYTSDVAAGEIAVELEAVRSGKNSLQRHRVEFERINAIPAIPTVFSATSGAMGHSVTSVTAGNHTRSIEIFRVPAGDTFDPMTATLVKTHAAVTSGGVYAYTDGESGITNLLDNGDFSSDTIWVKGTGWTISSGKARKSSGVGDTISQVVSMVSGDIYRGGFTISDYVAGNVRGQLTGGTSVTSSLVFSANGPAYFALSAGASSVAVNALTNGMGDLSIDNFVFFKETGTQAPQGYFDYYAVPYNVDGVAGPARSALNRLIV